MIFLPLLVLGIVLFIIGHRVASTMILLFFITNGYQCVPLVLFDTFIGISKPLDFAIVYVFALFLYGCIMFKEFIPNNKISKTIGAFLLFIIISMFVSHSYGGVTISDIARETRYFFFVLAYFILRRLETEEIESIIKKLLYIVVFQSAVFILQPILSMQILNGYAGEAKVDGWPFLRYYNLPTFNTFFLFYLLFVNPVDKTKKWIFFSIILLALIFTMHRSLIAIVILLIIIGFYLKYKKEKKIFRVLAGISLVVLPFIAFASLKSGGKTGNDIKSVMAGEFVDFDVEEVTADATLVFRIAHFYERYMFALESPRTTIFGLGFMTENSANANRNFDFFVGLEGDNVGDVIQFDTSDIAWSNFVVRLGFGGTFFYLSLYFVLLITFFKKKRQDISLTIALFMLLIFLSSITSSQLYYTWLLIIPFLLHDKIIKEEQLHE